MKIKKDIQLTFVDVMIMKNAGRILANTVRRKKIRSNRYLNTKLHHNLRQFHSVAKTIKSRLRKLVDRST